MCLVKTHIFETITRHAWSHIFQEDMATFSRYWSTRHDARPSAILPSRRTVTILTIIGLLIIVSSAVVFWFTLRTAVEPNTSRHDTPGLTINDMPPKWPTDAIFVSGTHSAASAWQPQPTLRLPLKIVEYQYFTVGYNEQAKNPA